MAGLLILLPEDVLHVIANWIRDFSFSTSSSEFSEPVQCLPEIVVPSRRGH